MDDPAIEVVLSRDIPPLPFNPERQFSNRVISAHQLIQNAYQQGREALYASDSDPHRLRIHSEKIRRRLPLLQAMEGPLNNEDWIVAAATLLAQCIVNLEELATAASLR